MFLTPSFRLPRLAALNTGKKISGYIHLWRQLLASCLPETLAAAIAPHNNNLKLILGNAKGTLYQGDGHSRRFLAELESPSSQILPALLSGIKEFESRACLELPSGIVVTRILTLPSQARKNLRQVIAYEIDRLTPFNLSQVYFDFRTLDEQVKPGRISLQLAVCRREPLKGWLERMRELGFPVDRIIWQHAWHGANLLPEAEGPKQKMRLLRWENLLLLLVVVMLALALGGPIWQKSHYLESLERELSDLKVRAKEVESLRQAIDAAHHGSVAVLERKADKATMVDLLRELTDRLPDGTWVENLEYQGNEVQIRGESTQAAALIGLLEQAPIFSGVAFRSPVSQIPNTDRERFHIGCTYQKKGG